MDEEGQKYKVAYCSDRHTENRDKQFCTESLPSLEAIGVFLEVLMHLHAWTYGGQVGLHALKLIRFVVRDASKERMRETASLLAASVDRKERIFPILRN